MGVIEGSASVEIDAPLERCYEISADLDHIDEWQKGIEDVEVLERDADGNGILAEIATDAKVRTVHVKVRFDRSEAPRRLSWSQEKGDLKSLDGFWEFEDLGDGRTKATYGIAGDPGRMLGMLIRGPVEGRIRDLLIGNRPEELKGRAEMD